MQWVQESFSGMMKMKNLGLLCHEEDIEFGFVVNEIYEKNS